MKITKQQLTKFVKEELDNLKEYEEDNPYASGPQFSDVEQQAVDAINAAADAIVNMGQSNPEMTDVYIGLFRVLERAGVNTEAVSRMT